MSKHRDQLENNREHPVQFIDEIGKLVDVDTALITIWRYFSI